MNLSKPQNLDCENCRSLTEITDLDRPYLVRTCKSCGTKIKIRETASGGLGLQPKEGDKIVIPSNFLTFSANPLKAASRLTRHGMEWFAKSAFFSEMPTNDLIENADVFLQNMMDSNEFFFANAEYLQDIDLDDPENEEEVYKRISENQNSTEWLGYFSSGMFSVAKSAVKENNAQKTAWAVSIAEKYRALAIFRENFEEITYLGHSSSAKLIDLLRIWDANKENSKEKFWQEIFTANSFAFGQVYSTPVVFIEDHAYVGGQKTDQTSARIVDFLFASGNTSDAIFIEIKTPMTSLMAGRYRGVYKPSQELSGSIVQVSDYLHSWNESVSATEKFRKGVRLSPINPRRLIVVGNYEKEFSANEDKKLSFELFRSSLSGVEIIIFDELFRKIEQLAKLFSITRKTPDFTKNHSV